MNESIKNMIERRSVRGYKSDMIPKEDLEKLFQKFYRVEHRLFWWYWPIRTDRHVYMTEALSWAI